MKALSRDKEPGKGSFIRNPTTRRAHTGLVLGRVLAIFALLFSPFGPAGCVSAQEAPGAAGNQIFLPLVSTNSDL